MWQDLYDDLILPAVPDLFRRFPRPQPGAARPAVEPFTPEEEESKLAQIAGAGLGGLAYVGSMLEKASGKRAIMGALAGRPRELLSVLPFSDTLEITRPEQRVGGRELLREYGLAGDEDTWGNFGAGLALDVALDPATYLTFGAGALTHGGKVAQKAGILPQKVAGRVNTTLADLTTIGAQDFGRLGQVSRTNQAVADALAGSGKTFAEVAAQPLGYSVGVGLPFRTPAFGLGQAGLDAAGAVGRGLGAVDAGLRSVPLAGGVYGMAADTVGTAGRYARSLFDPKVKEAVTHAGQETALEASALELPFLAAYKQKAMGYADELAQHGLDPTGDVLRGVAEGTFVGPVHPVIESVARRMRGDFDEVLSRLQGLGVNVQELADLEANYLPRYWTPLERPTGGLRGRLRQALGTDDPRLAGRRDFLMNVPGATGRLNDLARDAAVRAAPEQQAVEMVRRNYLGMTAQDEQALASLKAARDAQRRAQQELMAMSPADRASPNGLRLQQLAQDTFDPSPYPVNSPEWTQALQNRQRLEALQSRFDQAADLAYWARSLDPQYAASAAGPNPLQFFGNHPLADYATYSDRASRVYGAAEAMQNLLAKSAVPGGQGTVGLADALRRAGLVTPAGANPGAEAELLRRVNALRGPGQQVQDLAGLAVPENIAAEAARYLRGFTAPEAVGVIGAVFDKLTDWTKASQTAPWPAFHVRNLTSGQFQNWVKGMGEAPGGMLKYVRDAYDMARGGTVADANLVPDLARRGLTAEQATRELAREMYAWGVGGHLPHLSREVQGPSGQMVSLGTDLASFRARAIGNQPNLSPAEAAAAWLPRSLEQANPLNVAGVATNADVFAPVAAGRQLGDLVENVNRGSLYLSLRRQGFTPEQAAREVIGAHFDYTRGAKTAFEKNVASRLIPFYTFSRQNLPYQLEQLAQTPGGAAGQLAKLSLATRQQAGFLPEYLGGGLAVPVGPESESGTRRYLTQTDLPPEQAFQLIRGGPNGAQQSVMGLLGQLNPMLKLPIEYGTGKQLFTGRDLGDLYSLTGSVAVDELLANSPFSRLATTARTLADERKWESLDALAAIPVNLGTGIRLSDVDLRRAKDVAARDYVKAGLQGNPAISKFETLAPKPGAEDYLTPEEWALLRMARTLERQAQERARLAR